MKVLILAAGYGTRLYPLITDTPKPLLLIAERPLIDYSLDSISGIKDLKEVLIVTNQKFVENFQDWAKTHKRFPAAITIVNDGTTTPENRLGSVGDIAFTLNHHPVNDDLLVLGGDNLFDYKLDPFVSFAILKAPRVTIGLYDIKKIADASKFGVVAIDQQKQITSFEEKPAQPKTSLIAMCSYYLPKASLGLVEQYLKETKKADKAGDYIHWLVAREAVYGYEFQGRWFDIGSLEAYRDAQEEFKKKKK